MALNGSYHPWTLTTAAIAGRRPSPERRGRQRDANRISSTASYDSPETGTTMALIEGRCRGRDIARFAGTRIDSNGYAILSSAALPIIVEFDQGSNNDDVAPQYRGAGGAVKAWSRSLRYHAAEQHHSAGAS